MLSDLAGHAVLQAQVQRFKQLVVFLALFFGDAHFQRAGHAAAGRQGEVFLNAHGGGGAHHRVLKDTADVLGALAAVPDEASAQARLTGALSLVQWGVILNIMLAVIAR